jgi:hypothetical protein
MNQIQLFGWSAVVVVPGTTRIVLRGKVFGHPKYAPYTDIITSEVVRITVVNHRYVVATRTGSAYILGIMDGDWAERHPQGKRQLMNNFLVLPRLELQEV